ncbi:MAG: metal-dependent hydrolase [Acidobacteria bacterium]|nr:metal-dependent hydrolase [Acidobacteriota bacterium]
MAGPQPTPSLRGLQVVWFGHSTFLVTSPRGVRVLFDPWLATNPACPPSAGRVGAVDVILITHGHSDHCGDAVRVARETGASVVAVHELVAWLERQGVKNGAPMNVGGRQTIRGLDITMVTALHSSSTEEGGNVVYLGPATGFVVRFEDGPTIYFAGDTGLFGDMRVIGARYSPSIAFLPIGDRYTMGPEDAAVAAEWLGVTTIVPMHYGTFPQLTGTPDQLREFARPKGIDVLVLRPGEAAN